MFKWVDYEKRTALFISGIDTNIAILDKNSFMLSENATGKKFKIKALTLDEAKKESEKTLCDFWKSTKASIDKIVNLL